MREILSDLVAEQQALDQFLQRANDRQWKLPTPAAGWSILDQISHLAHVDSFAAEVIEGGQAVLDAAKVTDIDEWTARGIEMGKGKRHQEIVEWWRAGRASLVDALSRREPKDRIPWVMGPMSARAFATLRLMETWAHGLDIKDALVDYLKISEEEDDPYADTPRLRHVAWLAHRMLRFAFDAEGEEFPESGIRVELVGPKFSRWVYGPEDTDQVIKGHAGEFCRVAVNRLDAEDTGLKTEGEYAEIALHLLRAY
ncbi:MAG: maleylpyruvate isomerase family mycothiol-dependent enzyme [Acidimicrobiia bacterium]|nr:maleylpyruvate isomerase family mycothiol-dependent enzyme [Acidimicrobiia bacterium]MBT8214168.1 maleylpyruvate isomerase family mycothiol-dependent enzyme [Acidimicrobiia bacterium]